VTDAEIRAAFTAERPFPLDEFQSRALDADISVQQNLKYHAALHGIGRSRADLEIARVLDLVAMTDRRHDRVNTLSGGQMRRVEIARALLHRPKLLLLDEPTVGLDIKSRADILGHVRRLLTAENIGVLWATHLIDEAGADDDVPGGELLFRSASELAAGRQRVFGASGAPCSGSSVPRVCAPSESRMIAPGRMPASAFWMISGVPAPSESRVSTSQRICFTRRARAEGLGVRGDRPWPTAGRRSARCRR